MLLISACRLIMLYICAKFHEIILTGIHTCNIFLEPDREIWDFSEGDWGLR